MSEPLPFARGLKAALGRDPSRPLVFVGNFEVEDVWAATEFTLPRLSSATGRAVVNRMDEFAILLGGADDHVVTKAAPDPGYLEYLRELGFPLPHLHHPAAPDPAASVSADVLADPRLLAELGALAADGAALAAHGVSELEERMSAATGVPLAAPGAATCKAVNSKNYSRALADAHGVRQPAGRSCTSLAELADALGWASDLRANGRPTVAKEAFGVSGKGIVRLDSARRGERVLREFSKQAEKRGADRTAVVIEEWVDKAVDLNYQFTLGQDGSVQFDFVKEALTEGGVHRGHRMPAALTDAQLEEILRCTKAVGAQLASDGYFGVVGVDALITTGGELFPLIEINARHNMSTYQLPLQHRFFRAGQVALARHYRVRAAAPVPFRRLRDVLDEPLAQRRLLINNFATVNAGRAEDGSVDGRVYGFLVADSLDEVLATDSEIEARLRERSAL